MNKGPCILVVDDERSIVRTLELILQRHGYRVVTAYDGCAAPSPDPGVREDSKAAWSDLLKVCGLEEQGCWLCLKA
jgi:hypothetical protein